MTDTRLQLVPVDAVPGQLELDATGDPCLLDGRPTGRWADLCDGCNAVLENLAEALR